jgi:hypothetical protein
VLQLLVIHLGSLHEFIEVGIKEEASFARKLKPVRGDTHQMLAPVFRIRGCGDVSIFDQLAQHATDCGIAIPQELRQPMLGDAFLMLEHKEKQHAPVRDVEMGAQEMLGFAL